MTTNKLDGVTFERILNYMDGCMDNYDISQDEVRVSYDKFDIIHEFLEFQERKILVQRDEIKRLELEIDELYKKEKVNTISKCLEFLYFLNYKLNTKIDELKLEFDRVNKK